MREPIAVAVVGLGAILPDAPDVPTFWNNIRAGRYSVREVPPERWRSEMYYDPDPSATDKTYSKIGGWVSGFKFDTRAMGIAIPPKVLAQIDEGQQWAISASFQALTDYGWPSRPLDPERLAVILGSALGGEHHYRSTIRIHLPEYLDILSSVPAFKDLPPAAQAALLDGMTSGLRAVTPEITEDTMPGELSNIIAGRVANVFNFSGPNYVADAACASSLAALQGAVEGLMAGRFDAVLTGGVDRNMGPEAFVKFCKIGALSPDGSRPYAEGANGFIMGEGAAIFLLKRLVDAERDGDKIYAVIRGIGGSSDGKGKGITAPNPIGQQRAIERAWKNAGLPPQSIGLVEGHGTSTKVGDLAEVSSLTAVFGALDLKPSTVALGSVKSNFGHLKSAAGGAGLLKAVLGLYDHTLPPSVNFNRPNPEIDFNRLPLYVNTQAHPWEVKPGDVRRAGVSAFGFGGTNFHVVVEEYLPGVLTKERLLFPGVSMNDSAQPIPVETPQPTPAAVAPAPLPEAVAVPYHGLVFLGAANAADLRRELTAALERVRAGQVPASACPTPEQVRQPERLVIDYTDAAELTKRLESARAAFDGGAAAWQALSVKGVYRGSGTPGRLAFLFPGQGSQYVNMLRDLLEIEPIVAETFREADAVMTPILGRPLTSYIFVDGDAASIARAEDALRDTTITQPAILTVNTALLRMMAKYGFRPEMVIGHSLGEYAALVAAGALTLPEALRVVSARGQEMAKVAADDNGCMAAVSAPLAVIENTLKTIEGYVVIANINSPLQSVIGGVTASVEAAIAAFMAAGYQATKIPVSHAFHTKIVAPASIPLRGVIAGMNLQIPQIKIIANVTGRDYPTTREAMLDILAAQVASPVQFVQGVTTLYEEGARVFVEIGPKRVLSSLASDILKDKPDVTILSTNHPRKGGLLSFHEALCRLYAAGVTCPAAAPAPQAVSAPQPAAAAPAPAVVPPATQPAPAVADGFLPRTGSVVISGAGLGLPGRSKHVFDDANILSMLNGEMRIEPLPLETRQAMLDTSPVRLVKSEAGAEMQTIEDIDQTIKLGGQRGTFDPAGEFGMPQERLQAIDISTQLAIAAGIEALRDAGIPLTMVYKQTSTGSFLPDRWKLPEPLADETGVIFASAFPGLERMADESSRFYESQSLQKQLEELRRMLPLIPADQVALRSAFTERIVALETELNRLDYHFDRRFIFRILAMGHSQFAEYIGARGPNTHVNAACATTTHAVAIAEDWIRAGRARRVIVVAGDDVISGKLSQWVGTSLMASGAATTEGDLRMAALPFDRRRNGMIIGMGAAALVVESEDAVRERGMRAIAEVIATHIANSAYHGTRISSAHVSQIMQTLLATAEGRLGLSRQQIAAETVFVSHETYTPARGGSASAEIRALRDAFGEQASRVVIANTKGFTGHTMGVGIEDVIAVKALQYGIVPPIANIGEGFEPDPELGDLNLSHGGKYPVQYALRLGAGFGSQLAMTLLRKIPGVEERVDRPAYRRWLAAVSGYPQAETEIVQRTLRILDQGAPAVKPVRSAWRYGAGPTLWAAAPAAPVATAPVVAAAPMPASAAPVVAVPTPAPAVIQASHEEIKAYLLAAVSQKTGYPAEVLDPDLDLEADLGIDTVKQAELFLDIRTQYNIPRRDDLRLSDYNTLAKVIGFVEDAMRAPALIVASAPTPATAALTPSAPAPEPADETPLEKVVVRRVPVPALRPRLDLTTPTGVTLAEGSRVIVADGNGKTGETLERKLAARQVTPLHLDASLPAERLVAQVSAWLAEGPIAGVYFLPALEVEPKLDAMDLQAWQAGLDERLNSLFHLMKALPEETFLVSATRMGGLHGYSAAGALAPMGGAVSGFTKSVYRERPQAFVKVVDFERDATPEVIANHLIEETLHDRGCLEVGWEKGLRYGIALVERERPVEASFELSQGSVFLISGGASAIIRPIVADLVSATRGSFYLMDRAPAPDPADPDIARLERDRDGLKADLVQRALAKGEKVTPMQVEQLLLSLERSATTLRTLEIIRQAGGKATYLSCDVTDPAAVGETVRKVLDEAGQIDVFLHAAGLERSRKLASKPFEEFHMVVSVKVDGFFNLYKAMQAAGKLPRAMLFFCSIAGRFGNSGQTDYASANDLLCKVATALRSQHPEIKAQTIDWSAWSGIGMASRGNIPELMKMAGIDMVDAREAAPLVRAELTHGGGEAVLAGALGILLDPLSPHGGADLEKADAALRAGSPAHSMLSHVTEYDPNRGLVLEADLDPQAQPYLRDHALDGTPVLPGVMGIEGFTVAARHIGTVLAADRGDLEVARLEDIQFLAPFKFYRNQPRRITWIANPLREADGLVVYVSLESERVLATRAVEHQQHFSGKVHLQPASPARQEASASAPNWNGAYTVQPADIYRLYFHGPAFQVLDGVQRSGETLLGRLNKGLPAFTGQAHDLLSTPTLVELCFQTAGIWEIGKTGTLALPRSIRNLTFYQRHVDGVAVYAEVTPRQAADGGLSFDARVVDAQGRLFLELEDYRTTPLPYSAGKDLLAPLQGLMG